MGQVLGYNTKIKEYLLNSGYLNYINPFIYHGAPQIRKHLMFNLAVISKGNQQHIGCILAKQKLIKAIINIALNDIQNVKREAIVCIGNMLYGGTLNQKQLVCDYGGVKALCQYLRPSSVISDKFVHLIVRTFEELLKEIDNKNKHPFMTIIEELKGFDYLEQRYIHQNLSEVIMNDIDHLLNKYWYKNEDLVFESINSSVNT
eukprot:328726_1